MCKGQLRRCHLSGDRDVGSDPSIRGSATQCLGDVTQVLSAIEQGDGHAAEQLLPLVYDELRKLAAVKLAQEKPGQTLQATALVHEAYLRLVDVDRVQCWKSRGQFFSAAAEAMRRILVDNARHKKRVKHGGNLRRQDLNVDVLADDRREQPVDLVALDDALRSLGEVDAQAAQVVKLRYFAGLTSDEAAQVLGMSPRSAQYAWTYARSWLHHAMKED